jgi:hypothetical protein
LKCLVGHGYDSPERDVVRDLVPHKIVLLQNGFPGVRITYRDVPPVFTIK